MMFKDFIKILSHKNNLIDSIIFNSVNIHFQKCNSEKFKDLIERNIETYQITIQ